MSREAEVYVPTPEEIAAGVAEIQARWTEEERERRIANPNFQRDRWTAPEVKAPDFVWDEIEKLTTKGKT